MENIENPESVKSIAETNFQICVILNSQGFHDNEILQILYRYLQLSAS